MSTKEIVQRYFEELKQRGRWESFLADDMTFTSFTSPVKEVSGKAAYLESTKRFFSMVKSVEVRDLIIDGAKACALTRYQLQAPSGRSEALSMCARKPSRQEETCTTGCDCVVPSTNGPSPRARGQGLHPPRHRRDRTPCDPAHPTTARCGCARARRSETATRTGPAGHRSRRRCRGEPQCCQSVRK